MCPSSRGRRAAQSRRLPSRAAPRNAHGRCCLVARGPRGHRAQRGRLHVRARLWSIGRHRQRRCARPLVATGSLWPPRPAAPRTPLPPPARSSRSARRMGRCTARDSGQVHGSFVLSGEEAVTVEVCAPAVGSPSHSTGALAGTANPRRHDHPVRYAADCAVAGSGWSRGDWRSASGPRSGPAPAPGQVVHIGSSPPRLASVYRPTAKASGCDAGAHTSRRRG
jgi:hypothetical protein